MLACTALVGCTNEDVIDNPNEQENGEAKAYVNVKLVMADEGYSRATTHENYAVGTEQERKIVAANSIFLFYDNSGNFITYGQLMDGSSANNEPDGGNEEADHNVNGQYNSSYNDAYIVLSGPDQELAKATQVLTIINLNATDIATLKGSNLDLTDALRLVTNSTKDPISATGNFLMTTSTYLEDTKGNVNDVNNDGLSNTTAITANNICDTQEEAKKNPVKIYVERAAAKVEVIFNSDAYDVDADGENDAADDEANKQQGADITVNGSLQAVKIKVTGVKLNNTNETTYLSKKLASTWTISGDNAPFANWNYAGNYRNYWAWGTNWNMQNGNEKAAEDVDGSILTSYTYAEATIASKTPMYCYEQTVATPNVDPLRRTEIKNPNVSTVLVAAQISGVKEGTTDYTGDLFQYGGVFYTESSYKNLILTQIQNAGYAKAGTTSGSYTDFVAGDLTIATDGTLSGIKVTVPDGTYYKEIVDNKTTDETTGNVTITYSATSITQDEINAFLNGGTVGDKTYTALDYISDAVGYDDGKCFYQIPIEHVSSTGEIETTVVNGKQVESIKEGTEYFYGVVRNHWYKLTINGVKHIGEAVYNDGVKIPQIPEKSTEFYLAAELHVLSWHVVEQNVTLD